MKALSVVWWSAAPLTNLKVLSLDLACSENPMLSQSQEYLGGLLSLFKTQGVNEEISRFKSDIRRPSLLFSVFNMPHI